MADPTIETISKPMAWFLATRPKTLVLALGPILLAGLLALDTDTTSNWLIFPIIILSAVCIQIATNLWNDAADATSGLDNAQERLGPPRMTSLGLLQAGHVRLAAVLFLLLASIFGLSLVFFGGWPILAIGIVGILCAFGYSSGPYPISSSPFGELFVISFFGIMSVMGTTYLLIEQWTLVSFWAGLYIGLPAAAVLTVNNHRDRDGDKLGGRHTLVIEIGPKRTKQVYAIFILVSCIGIIHVHNLLEPGTLSLASLIFSALLMAYSLMVPIRHFFLASSAAELNACLMRTSIFQLQWVLAFGAVLLF
ncbi:1,4-dihydroxy-2-naphthoate octaprenyltransferase [uncultured Cohaesibacter sp.]|uniref:1,4-dihydroxy-2-naphthoate octaprenyltransferase n=1 Tax=uncultured Cohaesibacter sp. TaxID=1002546 RepID=UPI002930843D|nr:1,4-dihydroxy-2-naphthoate octaprenyltransferase [uncultured Cohaesibacter sp.]